MTAAIEIEGERLHWTCVPEEMSQAHRHFDEDLEELKGRLLAMGGLAEDRLRMAMRALVARDRDTLADVIAGDSRIDDLQIEIDFDLAEKTEIRWFLSRKS